MFYKSAMPKYMPELRKLKDYRRAHWGLLESACVRCWCETRCYYVRTFEPLNLGVLQISHSGACIVPDLNPMLGLPRFPYVLGWRSRLHVHVLRGVEEIPPYSWRPQDCFCSEIWWETMTDERLNIKRNINRLWQGDVSSPTRDSGGLTLYKKKRPISEAWLLSTWNLRFQE